MHVRTVKRGLPGVVQGRVTGHERIPYGPESRCQEECEEESPEDPEREARRQESEESRQDRVGIVTCRSSAPCPSMDNGAAFKEQKQSVLGFRYDDPIVYFRGLTSRLPPAGD
jgi:hypothetical protein